MQDRKLQAETEPPIAPAPGDIVEATSEAGRCVRGTVELAAKDLGILWIRTASGERKILVESEDNVRLVREAS